MKLLTAPGARVARLRALPPPEDPLVPEEDTRDDPNATVPRAGAKRDRRVWLYAWLGVGVGVALAVAGLLYVRTPTPPARTVTEVDAGPSMASTRAATATGTASAASPHVAAVATSVAPSVIAQHAPSVATAQESPAPRAPERLSPALHLAPHAPSSRASGGDPPPPRTDLEPRPAAPGPPSSPIPVVKRTFEE